MLLVRLHSSPPSKGKNILTNILHNTTTSFYIKFLVMFYIGSYLKSFNINFYGTNFGNIIKLAINEVLSNPLSSN